MGILGLYDIKIVMLAFFAVLGISYLFQCLSMGISLRRFTQMPEIVIMIRNAQDKIEGIVEDFYRSSLCNLRDLWVVDRGSTDDTPLILEKLSYRYPGLKVFLLPKAPLEQSYLEIYGHIESPAVLFLDGNRLNNSELLILTNLLRHKKYIEMGLKYYKN